MVEAAMVFPIMILTILAVLWMLVYFYQQIDSKVNLHMVLRAESGAVCGNFNYVNLESDLQTYRSAQQIYGYDTVQLENKGILGSREKEIRAGKYLIDEAQLIRITNLTKIKEQNNNE